MYWINILSTAVFMHRVHTKTSPLVVSRRFQKILSSLFFGSRTVVSEENCLRTLIITQTLTEAGGQFSSGSIVRVRVRVRMGGSFPQEPLSGLPTLWDSYLFANFELFEV